MNFIACQLVIVLAVALAAVQHTCLGHICSPMADHRWDNLTPLKLYTHIHHSFVIAVFYHPQSLVWKKFKPNVQDAQRRLDVQDGSSRKVILATVNMKNEKLLGARLGIDVPCLIRLFLPGYEKINLFFGIDDLYNNITEGVSPSDALISKVTAIHKRLNPVMPASWSKYIKIVSQIVLKENMGVIERSQFVKQINDVLELFDAENTTRNNEQEKSIHLSLLKHVREFGSGHLAALSNELMHYLRTGSCREIEPCVYAFQKLELVKLYMQDLLGDDMSSTGDRPSRLDDVQILWAKYDMPAHNETALLSIDQLESMIANFKSKSSKAQKDLFVIKKSMEKKVTLEKIRLLEKELDYGHTSKVKAEMYAFANAYIYAQVCADVISDLTFRRKMWEGFVKEHSSNAPAM